MKKNVYVIKSILSVMLALAMLPFTFGCSDSDEGGLIINEVMTSNSKALIDGVYGSPDWIELYNSSNHNIDLSNYLITDNAQNSEKTILLPQVIIKPHEYQLIYASKTFDVNNLGLVSAEKGDVICVDFGLSKAGDKLIIADANYNVVQELMIPALDKDISYARKANGDYGFCAQSTPMRENTTEIYPSLETALGKAEASSDPGTPLLEGLIINEVVSKNLKSLPHSDCSDCDWIELYNASDEALLLDGYTASDKEYEEGKSNLDGFSIEAHGYFLICCCDDECKPTDGHCCVKMGISRYGETVFIYDAFGRTAASLEIPLLEADVSYARRADGSYGLCKLPTPNAENSGAITDTLAPEQMDSSDSIRINEVLPKNQYSIIDADGDRVEWVELYNSSTADMSLKGYYLSDKADNLEKWALPEVAIGAGGYLIVFLSGKNRTEGELHASFSLGEGDTELILYDANTDRMDLIPLSETPKNVSIGRAEDGSVVYYRQPTPYAENGHAYAQADQIGFFQTDGVYFSEVSAAHERGSGDNDWIELYNGTEGSVNLEGYYLSDDADNLLMWQIGSVKVSSNDYAVIEASSHPTRQTAGVAPFGIAAAGETLFLSDSSGVLVDVFKTGALDVGLSSGRIVGDASVSRVFFDNPTKGKANGGTVYIGYTAQPVFSETGLYQTSGFDLELSCKTAGASIYYTTDGSEPTTGLSQYSKPIAINKSCVVRAFAVVEGLVDSPIATYHFLFEQPHTVPVMCIAMSDNDFNTVFSVRAHKDIVERETYLTYYEADGKIGTQFPAGLKAKGRGTLEYIHQKSLAIHLRGSYGQGSVVYPFFEGLQFTEFTSLVLRNGGQDYSAARMRDSFISRAVVGLNIETAATRPVVVYVNGEYYGLYDLNEDLNAGYLETHYGADPDAVDCIMRNATATQGTKTDFLRVRKFAVNADMADDDVYNEFCQWVDADYFMDYIIVQSYTANSDMFNQKYWRSHDYSVKWRPVFYDLDFCFSNGPTRDGAGWYFTPEGIASANGSKSNMDIPCGLVKNKGWRDRYIDRYVELVMTYFKPDRLVPLIDEMAGELEPEMERHIKRWGTPGSVTKWKSAVDKLKSIVTNRPDYALEQLRKYFGLSKDEMQTIINKYS